MKETLLVVKHILSTSIFFLRALERKIPPFLQVCFSSHTSCSYSRAGSPSFSLRLPWDSTLARGELLAGEGFVRSFKVIKINSPKFFSEMSVILYIYSVSPYIYQRACILGYFLCVLDYSPRNTAETASVSKNGLGPTTNSVEARCQREVVYTSSRKVITATGRGRMINYLCSCKRLLHA